jgi:ankyrin repeat protein
LIREGADVNVRAANDQTPLHVAVTCESFGTLVALLRGKADPHLKDKQGRTPAQLTQDEETIRLLEKK